MDFTLENLFSPFKILTYGSPQQNKEESDRIEDVIWRDPEDKLEIESVELRDEEEDDDADDGHPPLKAGERVPGELNPAVRRKLTKKSFDFPSECWNLVQSPPVVCLHTEVPSHSLLLLPFSLRPAVT